MFHGFDCFLKFRTVFMDFIDFKGFEHLYDFRDFDRFCVQNKGRGQRFQKLQSEIIKISWNPWKSMKFIKKHYRFGFSWIWLFFRKSAQFSWISWILQFLSNFKIFAILIDFVSKTKGGGDVLQSFNPKLSKSLKFIEIHANPWNS